MENQMESIENEVETTNRGSKVVVVVVVGVRVSGLGLW